METLNIVTGIACGAVGVSVGVWAYFTGPWDGKGGVNRG